MDKVDADLIGPVSFQAPLGLGLGSFLGRSSKPVGVSHKLLAVIPKPLVLSLELRYLGLELGLPAHQFSLLGLELLECGLALLVERVGELGLLLLLLDVLLQPGQQPTVLAVARDENFTHANGVVVIVVSLHQI